MSKIDELNDLDDIEDDDFKAKKIKKKTVKNEDMSVEDENVQENIFVTNNPSVSTSYKEKLLKIYAELEAITDEEIQNKINDLKAQILALVEEKNASDDRLSKIISEEIDNKLQEDKDFHYLPKVKPNVISKAKDESPFFTPTNILLSVCFIAMCILSLILIIKL